MQLNYRASKPIYEPIKEGISRMIVMNVIVDIVYKLVDPRIKLK